MSEYDDRPTVDPDIDSNPNRPTAPRSRRREPPQETSEHSILRMIVRLITKIEETVSVLATVVDRLDTQLRQYVHDELQKQRQELRDQRQHLDGALSEMRRHCVHAHQPAQPESAQEKSDPDWSLIQRALSAPSSPAEVARHPVSWLSVLAAIIAGLLAYSNPGQGELDPETVQLLIEMLEQVSSSSP